MTSTSLVKYNPAFAVWQRIFARCRIALSFSWQRMVGSC